MTLREWMVRFTKLDAMTLDALAIGLALAAVSYGVFRTSEHVSPLPQPSHASVVDDRHTLSASGNEALLSPRANGESRTEDSSAGGDRTDAARECAPDKGVDSDCIFD